MSSALLNKKIEYWERQLLDLGKRNKMINYRETKNSTLKLVEPSFDELFKRLAVNEEVLTFKRPIDRETDIRVFSILSLLENLSSPLPVTIGDINAEGSILERQKTLKNIRSKARLSLEEQGTNILYLSFGFIEWQDGKGASAQLIKSPLILVPVVLALETLKSPYTLSKHEDDIVANPTLQHYLKTEYGIELPNFDVDKDTISGYFEGLESIADRHGWRIIKEVNLGLLSFLKISMYNDLLRNEERIKSNPIIRAMSGNVDEANTVPEELRTFNLDSIKTRDCYQVMSADSSQQDAILYSKNNISFVMQGPPGTGKSQTITNIIAEALADGKKVLFVSEKMAALQVVYRRLQDAHLADFCLPLHSYKANKKKILEQIGASLKLKQTKVKDTALNSLEELLTIRQELNQYAAELHQLNPKLNISCYEVYGKLEEVNDAAALTFEFTSPLDVTQAQLQGFLNKLKEYSLSVHRINCQIRDNPWEGLRARTIGYEYSEKMRQELNALQTKLIPVFAAVYGIKELPGLYATLTYESIPALIESVKLICELPAIPDIWLTNGIIPPLLTEAENAKAQCEKLLSLEGEIHRVFKSDIFAYDYNEWKEKLLAAANSFIGLPYVNQNSPYYYIKNASSLRKALENIGAALSETIGSFANINELLGVELVPNGYNQRYITELLKLIAGNEIIIDKWFSEDLSNLKNLTAEAKANVVGLAEAKDNILSNWEAGIIELDYSPILLRYKTEYTGFFKVFKPQYHNDKKRLQALSKNVLKKLPDDEAIKLLFALKDYHERETWFDIKKGELSEAIGSYYNGINTNWDVVIHAIETAEKIRMLPIKCISERLINILSSDHEEIAVSLKKMLDSFTAAFNKVQEIIDSGFVNMDINSMEFNAITVLPTIEEYKNKIRFVEEQTSHIIPYLIRKDIQIDVIFHAIECLNNYNDLAKAFSDNDFKRKQCFDSMYIGRGTDWENIIALLKKTREIQLMKSYPDLRPIININDARKQEIKSIFDQISDNFTSSRASYNWMKSQFSEESLNDTFELSAIISKLDRCLKSFFMLEGWIDYQEAKNDCLDSALADFIEKIEEANLYTDVERIFLRGFYHMWLNAVCEKSASVRRFRRNTQDERIKKFIELDDLQLLIAQMRIREKLIENLPSNHTLLKATDELAILNKELNKKRNIMPLRKLFKLIPNLLMKLKPCLMMSPLSVSYFLETEAYHFDLVIFDEASQIFPEDAIGAIFRGAQVIIAGDSKQLPPTNFFAATTNNFDWDYDVNGEGDYDDVVSDSILEETAAVLPNRTLLWHYRSKHESLIAFSNREIYENNLITFPSSVTKMPDMGVEYVYVADGYYEGGGKNCNIKEAQKCVMLVMEHIQKHPDRSLGIIAFSEKQQAAIENAIIDFRQRMPRYEWFFDEYKDEPLFVKNLENVQGDERDTIIFSICYAKDCNGRMYMRFGPLGHAGGERRLNVAITRAKCNVKLVGSILPSDIDLNRTNSEGVRMLRSYIEFAIKGTNTLKPVENGKEFESEDDFCGAIAAFLTKNGYEIETQVGCSDYKIDIAVKNPKNESEYIAGIECDGISYIRAKTARDRDHLRRTILQNMGWNLYRVWSTEWVRNPGIEGGALLAFLRSTFDENGNVNHYVRNSNNDATLVSMEHIASESAKQVNEASSDNPYDFIYYEEARWWEANHSDSHDNLTIISENILHIVSIEQPMHIELLYKRIGPYFDAGKVTESIKNTVNDAIVKRLIGKVKIDSDRFIWLLPETPVMVRIPKRYDTPRPIEYIHTKEVAAAMIRIIERSFGITMEDLATECTRVFGFERKGPKIRNKTDAAINFLIETGKIKIIDGKAQLIGGR